MTNWKIINKKHDNRPKEGTYKEWKPLLRDESEKRCVYCSINDARLGGVRIFHVEHFKPKGNKKFPKFKELENDYDNLFYVCPICNSFKGDSWFDVETGNFTETHYPDPQIFDYSIFFDINEDFTLQGNYIVGRFLVERLHLNRSQLIRERKFFRLISLCNETIQSVNTIFEEISQIVREKQSYAYLEKYSDLQAELNKWHKEHLKLYNFLLENGIHTHNELS